MRSLLALAVLLVLGAAATAAAAPAWVAHGGSTLAVVGTTDEGGVSLGLSALWPVLPRVQFGVMAFADDLGAEIGDLRDPNDGTWIGRAETAHRNTFGAAWRADAELTRGRWRPLASASWGYYRVQDDLRGELADAVSSAGFSLGLGVGRAVSTNHALAVAVRYHRLLNDVAGRYVTASLEWRYAPSTAPSPAAPTTER
jgi:hypothetical protein